VHALQHVEHCVLRNNIVSATAAFQVHICIECRHEAYSMCIKDNCSPVRRLEREAIVGSLEDIGPVDGRSNLQCIWNIMSETQKKVGPLRHKTGHKCY